MLFGSAQHVRSVIFEQAAMMARARMKGTTVVMCSRLTVLAKKLGGRERNVFRKDSVRESGKSRTTVSYITASTLEEIEIWE